MAQFTFGVKYNPHHETPGTVKEDTAFKVHEYTDAEHSKQQLDSDYIEGQHKKELEQQDLIILMLYMLFFLIVVYIVINFMRNSPNSNSTSTSTSKDPSVNPHQYLYVIQ